MAEDTFAFWPPTFLQQDIRFIRSYPAENAVSLQKPYSILSGKTITHIEKDTGPLQCEEGRIITETGHNRIQSFRIFLDRK